MNRKLLLVAVSISVILTVALILGINKSGRARTEAAGIKPPSASFLVNQAEGLLSKNNLSEAKNIYLKLISDFPNSGEVMNWQKKAESINMALLFSPQVTAKSVLYEIKPGDTLTKIAREYKTTPELIMKSNNLSKDLITTGRKIKVWNSSFSIVVDKSQNTLILKSGEEIMKTYIVATGENNSTPVGTFKITSKLTNPTWFKAGAVVPAGSPENILGTRWMGFDLAGYGIHGTTDPKSLGTQVTQGCVRMANSDVEELYIIITQGTEVTIVD